MSRAEYRVAWRREVEGGGYAGRMRGKVFQSEEGARKLVAFLEQYTSDDPADWPCEHGECVADGGCRVCDGTMRRVTFLALEVRKVGPWEVLQ